MISSTSNAQVKYLIQLQSKSKVRRENKQFVVEGVKLVEEAPNDRIVKVYASYSFSHNNKIVEYYNKSGIDIEIVSDNIFIQMSDTKTPQGIMAIVKMQEYTIADIIKNSGIIPIIENLQDPGNLGTIIRTGEGAGISGVLMSNNTVDIYNPKTIRATMGSVFRVPFMYSEDFFKDIDIIKKSGIKVYAAHLKGEDSYTQKDYTTGAAFLIGNEGKGLTDEAAGMADTLIKIPMSGQVESLNAAIAATILLYEAKRQIDMKA